MPFNLNSFTDKAGKIASQARDKAKAAKAESALLGKTVQAAKVVDNKRKEITNKVGAVAGDTLNQITGNDKSAEKVAKSYQKVETARKQAKQRVKDAANQAAEATAERITDITGRETTAREVKTAAAITGVVVGAAYLADMAMEGAMEGMNGLDGGGEAATDLASSGGEASPVPASDVATGSEVAAAEPATGAGKCFEDQANEFFADKGGINIETSSDRMFDGPRR